jgi:hypothetical protein
MSSGCTAAPSAKQNNSGAVVAGDSPQATGRETRDKMQAQPPPDPAALWWWRRKNPARNRFCCDAALNPWQDFAIRVRTVLLSQFGRRDSSGNCYRHRIGGRRWGALRGGQDERPCAQKQLATRLSA